MMNWFFRWWCRGFEHYHQDKQEVNQAEAEVVMRRHFPDGMTFQVVDAENGKILKVTIPEDPQTAMVGGFNPRKRSNEKLYVIPEGENVIEFVTRALVEERIK